MYLIKTYSTSWVVPALACHSQGELPKVPQASVAGRDGGLQRTLGMAMSCGRKFSASVVNAAMTNRNSNGR